MITQHQFLLLIHILYCVVQRIFSYQRSSQNERKSILLEVISNLHTIHGILLDANDAETCNLLCIKCNGSAVFANGHCECNFVDDSNKECIQHIQKEIQAVELNMLSDDLTDEERKIRSVLKYRRRLRPGDAEKVAQYFINGGPEAGHSHFVRVFNATRDSIDSATNSFSGVVDKKNYTSYVSPTMQGVDLSTLGTKPPFIYPPTGVYDPTTVPLNTISHPHGLPHALLKAVTFPAHVLHRILHPRVYHHYPLHHRGIIRSSNFPQDTSDTDQTVGQCENNDGSNTSNFPIARSNADKPEQNVFGLNNPLQYPVAYIADELYQPMQYQNYPYPYNSYYNPLINMFHAVPNEYLLQSMSLYPQDKLSNPWTSASNPQSFCKNNINTEQKNEVLSADKTKYSNEMEKSDDPTKNNIPNEEKKTVKNGNDKS